MEVEPQRAREQDGVLSSNATNNISDPVGNATGMGPVKNAFGSASALLNMLRDSAVNEVDPLKLGPTCAKACRDSDRGINERRANRPGRPILNAIDRLTTTAAGIQGCVVKWGKRRVTPKRRHRKDDEEAISTGQKSDSDQISHVFETQLPKTTDLNGPGVLGDVSNADPIFPGVREDPADGRATTSKIRLSASNNYKSGDDRSRTTHASAPGESRLPTPRTVSGAVPNIHRGVMKACGAISKVQREVEDTNGMVADIHRNMLEICKGNDNQNRATSADPTSSVRGEPPPPPPRIFFGRDMLIKEVVGFAEGSTPTALIGAGGIGKTSIALTVLHDDRIKQRFGEDRRFIRCDQFPSSLTHFLRHLSKVIGAGIENPENLSSLRPFLSSKKISIVFDNAESILDPQGPDAEEIYSVIEELSQLNNIWLCITSRISTVPSTCETLEIPTLSMEAARDTFYRIYKHREQSNLANRVLEELDFHPLSVTLLATVAHQSKWNIDRLMREWGNRRTGVLQTEHNKSLAATIELSLASPFFQNLGNDARELLRVVAFYPQGVDEKNIEWLFPAISNIMDIFDKFCILSLVYRSEGSVKMLAPLRDYLSPEDPLSSPLLCMTKDRYFGRLVALDPGGSEFGETRWIVGEDTNVEHLLNVFISIDVTSEDIWNICFNFIVHLLWHKPRLLVLAQKIERLPDVHPSKAACMLGLSRLFGSVGNYSESRRLLIHTLELFRGRGDPEQVALTLVQLSYMSTQADLPGEGIQQAKEALGIYEQLGDKEFQALCLTQLAELLSLDNQFDAAVETASRAITLLENSDQYLLCKSHLVLGRTYRSKANNRRAIEHLEVALRIASPRNWNYEVFWSHHTLAMLYSEGGKVEDAGTHLEKAKLHAINDMLNLAHVTMLQACIYYDQCRFAEAEVEVLRAVGAFEKLGATVNVEDCWAFLRRIRAELN